MTALAPSSPAWVSIWRKAQQTSPEDRYQSALEISADVLRYLDGLIVTINRVMNFAQISIGIAKRNQMFARRLTPLHFLRRRQRGFAPSKRNRNSTRTAQSTTAASSPSSRSK